MIPNPSNSLLGNDGQPTLEQIQQRLAQQVQDNQNPNTAQQLIDLLQQSTAAMALKPGAGAEADQTLQQLNPTGTQSMQNLQNMRQEIEQERATDEYPFYDEKQLQVEFERQKKAEDKQWQTFISSYKQEMKDKISQEHKDHVTFMTATGGTPLNLGEFAQQTGYLGGNKLQEAWEAHKENAGNVPPLNLYDDYNQTLLDSMKHRDNFNMERYTDLHDNVRDIQKRISEHHAKGVDDLSQDDRYVVQNLMRSLNENARDIDNLSGESRNARNKEAEVHIRNIFPNGFNPSLFKDAILASDPDDYLKSNFKLNAHDVQNVTAEHHLEEVHPDTFNRIKESDLPLELKNSIINSNSLIPLYEQLADDIIEAHEAVDYTDGSKGIGNKIHEGLKDKYRSLTLKDEIRQPSISFEKLLYNKFSQSNHQDVNHLKDTMTAFNRHYDDDDVFTGSLFEYGLGNGFDYDIFRHLEKVNKERATMNKMFKSPLDYVIDNLIAKANLPTLRERGRDIEDQVALRWIPRYRESTFNAPIPLNRNKGNIIWEQRLRNERLKAPENSAHKERVNLPGVFDDDSSSTPSNTNITGSWVSPATQQGAMGADVSFNDRGLLMAINENPDWWRTVRQGAAQESPGGEGFKYGGYNKEAYSKIPTPNISPISMLHYQMALENPNLNEDEVAEHFPNEHELIQQFPNVDTRELWGEPATLASTINPINPRKVASEPMNIAMRLLKANEGGQPTVPKPRYHEMSNEDLGNILHGWGYDVGEGKYKTDETLSTQEEKDAAYQELLNRQREAEANPVSVFSLNEEEKSRLADFYEPQFTGQNIDPDTFIPQTEEEGLQAYGDMEEGELDDHIEDRLLAIDEFMPGKSFMADQDPMAKYHHLKTTAGDEVAENYLNRYRDFVMRHSENPEYMYQQLMQMLGEIPEVTAPQYTQKFPTDESIFDNKPPNVMMNAPDATGFEHDWQAKNASEPMDLAMDVLLKDRISPEAKQHKLEYDKKYESSPERVKYREELNRERRKRGIYGKHNHMDVSHTEGGKLTLESEHGNRARHFKEKGTLRHEE